MCEKCFSENVTIEIDDGNRTIITCKDCGHKTIYTNR